MLYEEWKSRYKNLKNFNTVLQRCPRFWPLAPPRGMNPGVYSLGISEDPPRYLSSKFDASVRSDCWDISIWKTLTQCDGNGNANANANVDDRGDYNSSPCTSYRRAKNDVRPAKTQISLRIRPVWSESSLCAQWVAKDPSFLHADSEDWSDWADAQADLSLRRAPVNSGGFVMRWLTFSYFCTRNINGVIQDKSES